MADGTYEGCRVTARPGGGGGTVVRYYVLAEARLAQVMAEVEGGRLSTVVAMAELNAASAARPVDPAVRVMHMEVPAGLAGSRRGA